ncbi:MAG: phospho-sugar mutase [Propionibacteriaceae bacterium]|jgi:phosphomannomutase|nr:phospho-sugar mutase [Propionibacteriaceae bacterium]
MSEAVGLAGLLEDAARWIDGDPDPATRAELAALVVAAADDPAARADLADRFAGSLQFGTAGLRGAMAAGPNRMNRAVVIRAAKGLVDYLAESLPGVTPLVAIGSDARHHSREFALDSAAIVTAAGAEARLLPPDLPTPLLAYAVRALGADAGVMVTASHNPAADNGYKVYLGGRMVPDAERGVQIVAPHDAAIAAKIAAAPRAVDVPRAESGWTELGPELWEQYVEAIGSPAVAPPAAPIKIVHTSMHGVGHTTALAALARAGFTDVTVVAEQRDPDPDFPTVAFPNPEEPGALDLALALAAEVGADVVIANDPDADRCAVAVDDPRGGWRRLHGDELGAVLGEAVAAQLSSQTPLSSRRQPGSSPSDPDPATPPTLANSIVSSRQLGVIAAHHGVAYRPTLTGFKWMGRVPGLAFAYEEAIGYCVRPDLVHDKDGLSTAVAVARLVAQLKSEGRTITDLLDDLARRHGLYLTSQLALRFDDLSQIPVTMARLRANAPATLAGSPVVTVADLADGYEGLPPTDGILLLTRDDDRVVVRPSGTEPKVKCYLETVTPVAADAAFDTLTSIRAAAAQRLAAIKSDLNSALVA